MAVTAPTPPTPPTAPVVPGARSHDQSSGDGSGHTVSEITDDTFGVHITVGNPVADNGNSTAGENTGAAAGQPGQSGQQGGAQGTAQDGGKGNADSTSQGEADAVQQARQAMVQQALGLGEEDSQQETETTAVPAADASPWSAMHMSYVPFLIVFIAAFIVFTMRNLSKNKSLSVKPRQENTPLQGLRQQEKQPQGVPQQGEGLSAAGKNAAPEREAAAQDKSKGRHFEMRI